jgi:DNA topoisomerase-1
MVYSTKTKTKKILVIVESPAKCKKIESYLGSNYKCIASFGHIRELTSLKNIDIENNFNAKYTIVDNQIKKKQIDKMREEIQQAEEVVLATDDDREGESIAWHICQLFHLDISKTKRIIFHEITEKAIQKAIQEPTYINMNIVNSQQARQILDLIVGFKISPVLWKYISSNLETGLSAGRCQTPSLRLVYDNHKKIEENPIVPKFSVVGYFTKNILPYELNINFDTQEEVIDFLERNVEHKHVFSCNDPVKVYKEQPEPFNTSRLQQESSHLFHLSPKDTMKICQTLYEAGYITYMRTDCKKYSIEFINSASEYITKKYNPEYLHNTIHNIAAVVGGASAHEAIRPTNISLQELPDKMGITERKMYKMIWENTMESCMSKASYFSLVSFITAPVVFLGEKQGDNPREKREVYYKYTTELLDFPGWKIIKNEGNGAGNGAGKGADNIHYHFLLSLKNNSKSNSFVVPYKKIISKHVFTQNYSHLTESNLVKLLEERGIGRPSTFSMLVEKIQERGYVKKQDIKGKMFEYKDYELEGNNIYEIQNKREIGNEKGKLVIQPLGVMVVELLEKYFSSLFDYDYTSSMEETLDEIISGKKVWHELCSECWDKIDSLMKVVKDESKREIRIDDTHFYVIGKHGPVIKCIEPSADEAVPVPPTKKKGPRPKGNKDPNVASVSASAKTATTFIPVKQNIDIHKLERNEYKLEDIIEKQTNNVLGKYEDHDLIIKQGRFGLFASWGESSKSLKCFGNRPIENIRYEDVIAVLEKNNVVREISDTISIRKGKTGDYIFYKTPKMRKPGFYKLNNFKDDYISCDIRLLKDWIYENYNLV